MRCLAAKDSRTSCLPAPGSIREQSRTLYGTRDNGRSGDPVKILRRNYANSAMAVSAVPA